MINYCFLYCLTVHYRNDETEYCLGDAYIPLAAIFPHSKSVVHHEGEEMSLQLLEKVEREITMPNEPAVSHVPYP